MKRSIQTKINSEASPCVKIWRNMAFLFYDICTIWLIHHEHIKWRGLVSTGSVSNPSKTYRLNQNDLAFSSDDTFTHQFSTKVAWTKVGTFSSDFFLRPHNFFISGLRVGSLIVENVWWLMLTARLKECEKLTRLAGTLTMHIHYDQMTFLLFISMDISTLFCVAVFMTQLHGAP